MSQHQYTYYGLTCQAPEVRRFVEHLTPAAGQRATPICIWGRHGIGKTQMVEQIAVERGMQWRAIAPARPRLGFGSSSPRYPRDGLCRNLEGECAGR